MLRVYVTNQLETRDFEHPDTPLEFGRGPQRDLPRCIINDPFVSKDQLRVVPMGPGKARLDNLSTRNPLRVGEKFLIQPGESHDGQLPLRITIGKTHIDLSNGPISEVPTDQLRTIEQPLRQSISSTQSLQTLLGLGRTPGPEVLAQWFEALVSVQRAAATNEEFYSRTAQALVDLVGLDSGMVILRKGERWQVAAQYSRNPEHEIGFSERIARKVMDERRTFFQALGTDMLTASLCEIEAVVASPIFGDDNEEVVGIVYGSRNHRLGSTAIDIRPLEAQVVQVLAAAVGAGLARLEKMAEATRRYVQLEQSFTPELARELDRDPTLLEGRNRIVTVMFTDIRNFSRISERLGPADTCRLIRDVMETLTIHIRNNQGVVVDYMGDGLIAMWNAPQDQPDQATLACRAALGMIADLPALSLKWHSIVGSNLGIGVGINTGPAMVGNTGTGYKLKYGPLGHTVNLASRIEGVTKQMHVPILLTGSTHKQLQGAVTTRRLCKVRVVGIDGTVDLYELCPPDDSHSAERCTAYETALSLFEDRQFAECCRALYPLLSADATGHDIPTLTLLSRAVEQLRDPSSDFDPVWELDKK